jgi:hypothetical protein
MRSREFWTCRTRRSSVILSAANPLMRHCCAMSLHGSGALTVELPARQLADRATLALAVACALVMEAVASHYPEGPAGAGLGCGLCLAAWQLWRVRNEGRASRLTVDPDGRWTIESPAGRSRAVLLPGTRVLGRSVVLRWKTEGTVGSAWLTAADVPAARLRELRVRLLASGAKAGA